MSAEGFGREPLKNVASLVFVPLFLDPFVSSLEFVRMDTVIGIIVYIYFEYDPQEKFM